MTRASGAAVGTALGGACGVALWELFSTHSAVDALVFVLPCLAVYALVGAALSSPPANRAPRTRTSSTAWTSSAACPAVLPGVPLTHDEPVTVAIPRPRVVAATR